LAGYLSRYRLVVDLIIHRKESYAGLEMRGLYYRARTGRMLYFSENEIKSINRTDTGIFLETFSGGRYSVLSEEPERFEYERPEANQWENYFYHRS
jgi:hypothetical protein